MEEDSIAALAKAMNEIMLRLYRIESHLGINQPPSIAGPKLASIPELLEPILLHLPVRTLLLSQRVSKTFKAVIDNSNAIQRALFFAPEPEPASYTSIDVRVNPLLVDVKSYISIPLYNSTSGFGGHPVFIKGAGWNRYKLRIVECDVLDRELMDGAGVRTQNVGLTVTLGRLPGGICYGRRDDVGKSVHGSWRRMLLTQPPMRPMFTFESHRGSASGPSHVTKFSLGNLIPWKVYADDGTEVDAPDEEVI